MYITRINFYKLNIMSYSSGSKFKSNKKAKNNINNKKAKSNINKKKIYEDSSIINKTKNFDIKNITELETVYDDLGSSPVVSVYMHDNFLQNNARTKLFQNFLQNSCNFKNFKKFDELTSYEKKQAYKDFLIFEQYHIKVFFMTGCVVAYAAYLTNFNKIGDFFLKIDKNKIGTIFKFPLKNKLTPLEQVNQSKINKVYEKKYFFSYPEACIKSKNFRDFLYEKNINNMQDSKDFVQYIRENYNAFTVVNNDDDNSFDDLMD